MSNMRDWREYLYAAERQVQIAALFRGLLLVALADDSAWKNDRPKVETQAYFEGLIIATRAAEEKLYEAVCLKENFTKKDKDEKYDYAQAILKELASKKKIKGTFLASDKLRKLRNAMSHYAHDKRSETGGWLVCNLSGEEGSFPPLTLEEYADTAYD